jgi:glycerophosphoryl diester phosphodiesterase
LLVDADGVCPGAVLSIGHRGNPLYAPENTVAAFKSALGKADMVEMDGQLTSDGALVIMHDATVDRTTDGTGSIAANTLVWLKSLYAGSWFRRLAGNAFPRWRSYH